MGDPCEVLAAIASKAVWKTPGWRMIFTLTEGDIFAFRDPPSRGQMRYTKNRFKVINLNHPTQGIKTGRVVAVDGQDDPVPGAVEFSIRDELVRTL